MQKSFPDNLKTILPPLLGIVAGFLVSQGLLDSNGQADFVAYATEAAGGVIGLIALFTHLKQAKAQATRESIALELEPGSTHADVTAAIQGFNVGSFLKKVGKVAISPEAAPIIRQIPAVGGVAGEILRQAREAKQKAADEEASRTRIPDPTVEDRVSNLEEIVEAFAARLVALEGK